MVTDAASQQTITFTDNFTGTTADSEYYYLAVAITFASPFVYNSSENYFEEYEFDTVTETYVTKTIVIPGFDPINTKTSSQMYSIAKNTFDSGTDEVAAYWSPALAARVSFLPEQTHIIYNDGNSSTDQGTGIITATSTDLGVIDFGGSASQTFKTTTHQGDKASVTWGYTLSLDGTVVTTPDTLTFTATEDSLVIDGNYATTNAAPGVYTQLSRRHTVLVLQFLKLLHGR